VNWRQRVALYVLGRLWPEGLEAFLTALVERAERAARVGEVKIPVAQLAALEEDLRRGHRSLYPRAVRHGRPVKELISDLYLAKALQNPGGEECETTSP
jgi:hypothetical protein